MKKIIPIIFVAALFSLGAPTAFATRLHTTGFETQSLTDENMTVTTNLVNALTSTTTVKRTGTASLALSSTITSGSRNGSRYVYPVLTIASTTVRTYMYITVYPNVTTSVLTMSNSNPYTTVRGTLKLTSGGKLQLFDGGGSQIGSDSVTIPLNTWVRVELKLFQNDTTTGTLSGRLEGNTFASSDTATTNGSPGAVAMGINLGAETATSGSWYFDDFALNNNAGSTQTDFAGAGAVINLYPNAVGDFAEGASNGSGVGYDDVDERIMDSDTTYWQLITNNDRLDVNVEDSGTAGIPSDAIITLVQENIVLRNDGTGVSTYQGRVKQVTNGTISQSAQVTIASAAWSVNDDGIDKTGRVVITTDPDGFGWTPLSLNTMQIGVTAADADPDLFITSMYATVEFTPALPKARIDIYKGRINFYGGRVLLK